MRVGTHEMILTLKVGWCFTQCSLLSSETSGGVEIL